MADDLRTWILRSLVVMALLRIVSGVVGRVKDGQDHFNYVTAEQTNGTCSSIFTPGRLESLREGTIRWVHFNITCSTKYAYIVNLTVDNRQYLTIDNGSVLLVQSNEPDPSGFPSESSFAVRGIQFGRTQIQFVTHAVGDDVPGLHIKPYEVAVVRATGDGLNLAFVITLGIMIVFYNIGFGCKLRWELITLILRRPVAPAIGFCTQFLLMAPVAFGLARALHLDDVMGLGLLAIGSCPGGGGSNVFSYLLDADLELSITMTFLSTLGSLVLTPAWIWGLGRYFSGKTTHFRIPIENVFASLAIVTLPVIAGLAITRFRPRVGARLAWCLKPFTGLIGAVFIGMGIYVYYYAFVRVTWQTMVGCTSLALIGYTVGLLLALLARQGAPQSVTIALETGFQNMALATIMLQISLPLPEADIAGVIPILYSFLSSAFPSVVFLVYWPYKRFRRRPEVETQDDQVGLRLDGQGENDP